ncbi:MAG TPA: helix-turn-helix domain-containing protein [Rhodospirillaceae bacterium]|nr:helix-turn-helix domain-containing protein [Rhodospirillaceae bacterium]
MTSSPNIFRLAIDPKSEKAADFIGEVRAELGRVLAELAEAGISKSDVAKRLEIHRSAVTRRIRGTENLTLRTLAEMAWAMNRDIVFQLAQQDSRHLANTPPPTASSQAEIIQQPVTSSSRPFMNDVSPVTFDEI